MARRGPVLLLTHSGDFYTVDLVAAAVEARGFEAIRVDTDRYPVDLRLTRTFGVGSGGGRLRLSDRVVDLDEVSAVWARRLWPGVLPEALDPRFVEYCRRESRTAFFDGFSLPSAARWVNPLPALFRAESKQLQLDVAARVGLQIPPTVITNDPLEAREFFEAQGGQVVTKLLTALSQTMGATGDFVYTSRVNAADLEGVDSLIFSPQIFQRELEKASELRVVLVGDELFAGAIDATDATRHEVDWRRLTTADDVQWRRAALPRAVSDGLRALLAELGLSSGAADLIVTPDGAHWFLELNPAGEWGWLQRDLGLPIAEAIAAELCPAEPDHG